MTLSMQLDYATALFASKRRHRQHRTNEAIFLTSFNKKMRSSRAHVRSGNSYTCCCVNNRSSEGHCSIHGRGPNLKPAGSTANSVVGERFIMLQFELCDRISRQGKRRNKSLRGNGRSFIKITEEKWTFIWKGESGERFTNRNLHLLT